MNIERIKNVPIEAIAERLGLSVTKHKCICPFHDDHRPSLSFRPSRNSFKCFVCDATGDSIGLVKKMKNMAFAEAVEWIADNFGLAYTLEDNYKDYRPRYVERKGLMRVNDSESMLTEKPATAESSIDLSVVERSLSVNNSFCKAILSTGILTEEQMQRAAERYHLGSTRDGGVIFWQIDDKHRVHEGKVMHYQDDCHRCRDRNPVTISWLIRSRKNADVTDISLPPTWRYVPCLFGLHLLANAEIYGSKFMVNGDCADETSTDETEPIIAVVESEKTAIVCSELIPTLNPKPETLNPKPSTINSKPSTFNQKPEPLNHPVIWLATGGLSNLSTEMLRPLVGRRVVIFPDTDPEGLAYRKWKSIAEKAEDAIGTPFPVSPILELNATQEQKEQKIDILDYLGR